MEAVLGSLQQKMRRYRTTRRWLSRAPPAAPEDEPASDELQKCQTLELQHRMNGAIARYAAAVLATFEGLLAAQQALQEMGADQVESVAPVAEALVKGLRQAVGALQETVRGQAVPLEVHRKATDACAAELAHAAKLADEARRYSDKVDNIVSSEGESDGQGPGRSLSRRSEDRVTRNRSKLRSVEKAAKVAHARAQHSLSMCVLRKASLDEILRSSVISTVEALRQAVSQVPAAGGGGGIARDVDDSTASGGSQSCGCSPVAARPSGAAELMGGHHINILAAKPSSTDAVRSNQSTAATPRGGPNPFDEDDVNSGVASQDGKELAEGGDVNPFQGEADLNPFKEDVGAGVSGENDASNPFDIEGI